MRRYPGEEGARALTAERRSREHARRAHSGETEPRHRERMARHAEERPERVFRELVPVGDQRCDESAVGAPVWPEALDRKSTRLNSSPSQNSNAGFCFK